MDTQLFRKYGFKVIDAEFWIEISDSEFETSDVMNRLDIWIKIIQIIQNLVEFRPLKAELLLRQCSSLEAHLNWSVLEVYLCGLFQSHKKWKDSLEIRAALLMFSLEL